MEQAPIFLTDKSRTLLLEVIEGAPQAALPDCLSPFDRLEPGASEGASEKHLPVIRREGCHVTVEAGSVPHPMDADHSITWIILTTKAGCIMRVPLTADCTPTAHFTLEEGDEPAAAYSFCNLHGLWKAEYKK